ncbi:glycoside hydrolase family 5 protein [Cubamyces sp. BRFM 1775]|nr:glycoside hydrolase family 5 protein [Cubamyces sp. BRFM 1775]
MFTGPCSCPFVEATATSMISLKALLAGTLLAIGLPLRSAGFPYGHQKFRGVNLAGWLVLEPWITPSLFDNTGDDGIVDEWTFAQYQDHNTTVSTLQNHWDTFITEQDFVDIANAGLNLVRIPIGYWAFDVKPGEPYISGQLPYLQKAVGWARDNGLQIIVDLHGAPGSQNGYDSSGQRLPAPLWHTNQTNIERTKAVIQNITDTFSHDKDVVSAIEPLNDPAGYYSGGAMLEAVRQYYQDSYASIHQSSSSPLVVLHDASQSPAYWRGFETPPSEEDVAMDTHSYQIFNSQINNAFDQHVRTACQMPSTLSQYALWVIVGEWTPSYTDCAKYLNGRGVGARYDGSYPGSKHIGSCDGFTGSGDTFSQEYITNMAKYWDAQTTAFENVTIGWIQRTWKTESADEWSYQAGLKYGWIPQNASQHTYTAICDDGQDEIVSATLASHNLTHHGHKGTVRH